MPLTKSYAVSFNATDGAGLAVSLSASASAASAGVNALAQPQLVPTAWSAVNIGQCSAAELLAVNNLDATNYVQFAIDALGTYIVARLAPGQSMLVHPEPGVTIYARANTAACLLEVGAAEP